MIYGLILAGGKGSRLYPLSRADQPKQFLKLINDNSFLVNTVDRIVPLISRENIYVVTNRDYEYKIRNELSDIKEENVFTEPSNKETATCIGYGYIEMGERISGNIATYKVARFTEKPNVEVAKDFLVKETYLWNSGMFVFRADVILREIEKYLPKMHKALMEIYKHVGEEDEEEVIKEQYELIDGISIDFGVMQKTRKAYVIRCDFPWDDIGSFSALSRFLMSYRNNNVSKNVYLEECENCSIFGEKNLIIGLGVKDLVVVDAGDVILVMDRARDQEIKHLLNNLSKNQEYHRFL